MNTSNIKSFVCWNDKDNHFAGQLKIVYEYLKTNIATGSMVAKATGVPHKCFTRYKQALEKNGHLKVTERKRCKVTGLPADYVTCNPEWFPVQRQLSLFNSMEGLLNA
ncbi:hypothetical protein [Rubrolithibacter danxiaensis]|uniref:hypothetical protein n=1 Tax=Rubrolithibacter danxiaensis TaxID=3390805 RepID=UPI003BF91550